MEVDYNSSKFDFVIGSPEIKTTILVNFDFFRRYFVSLQFIYFFAFITLGDIFFLFQDNKVFCKLLALLMKTQHSNQLGALCH